MTSALSFKALNLSFANYRTYLFGAAFVAGNLLFPQLCHLIPGGGLIWLPIYFFTLIAAYKFGLKIGLLTAVLSPLANYLLFGMPVPGMLPIILIKSGLLAFAAALIASKTNKLSLLHLLVVILAYQLLGGLAEWGLTGSFAAALQDFRLGLPGLLVQLFGGWLLLKALAKYELK
ncbi:MAG: ECF transporter S component [Bacteroidales bacterium]|jgi:hypothetical protein|nr:ECF transporter S component [Bacteroidales bacterium]MDD4641363.1 ECF transporter S component [Bacteroidales bacterium]